MSVSSIAPLQRPTKVICHRQATLFSSSRSILYCAFKSIEESQIASIQLRLLQDAIPNMPRDPELEAVESALNSLALADTDTALERVLRTLLPALLTALGTKSSAARARIVEALQHINVRIRASPNINLPFSAVLSAAILPNASLMTTNVAIQGGYVARCHARLSPHEQASSVKELLSAAQKISNMKKNSNALYALALKALPKSSGRSATNEDEPLVLTEGFLEYTLGVIRAAAKAQRLATLQRLEQEMERERPRLQQPQAAENAQGSIGHTAVNFGSGVQSTHNSGNQAMDHLAPNPGQLPGVLSAAPGVNNGSSSGSAGGSASTSSANRGAAAAPPRKVTDTPDTSCLIALVSALSSHASMGRECGAAVFPHLLILSGRVTNTELSDAASDALKRLDNVQKLLESSPHLATQLLDLASDKDLGDSEREAILSKALVRAPGTAILPNALNVLTLNLSPNVFSSSRLISRTLEFFDHVLKNADAADLRKHEPDVRNHLLQACSDSQLAGDRFVSDPRVRAYAFSGLAELARRVPEGVFSTGASVPRLMLDTARDTLASKELRMSASQALMRIATVYKLLAPGVRDEILKMLCEAIADSHEEATGARSAALLWANTCFEFEDCDARLLNIVASADSRPEVRDAAVAGLSPKKFKALNPVVDLERKENPGDNLRNVKFPQFEILLAKAQYLVEDSVANAGENRLRFAGDSWAAFFQFALTSLRRSAPTTDMQSVAAYVEENETIQSAVNRLLQYANKRLLTERARTSLRTERAALAVVLTAAQIIPTPLPISSAYAKDIGDLLDICKRRSAAGDLVVAEGFASLIGIASLALEEQKAIALLNQLGEGLEAPPDGKADSRQGEDMRSAKILALGYIISQHMLMRNESKSIKKAIEDNCSLVAGRVSDDIDSSQTVRAAACKALSCIGSLGPLPVVSFCSGSTSDREILSTNGSFVDQTSTTRSVIETISKAAVSSKAESQLVELACLALGAICVGQPTTGNIKVAVRTFLTLAKERKEEEIRFTVAENLVRCATGFNIPPPRVMDEDSKGPEDDDLEELLLHRGVALRSHKGMAAEQLANDDVTEGSLEGNDIPTDLPKILDRCVDLCTAERPNVRASGCVFLFTFLRLIGTRTSKKNQASEYKFAREQDTREFQSTQECIADVLQKAQRSFSTLLGDRSELVQQLASRGVALVYELSPTEEQKELVFALVRSLTANKARAGTIVPGDQGGLVEIPTGNNSSSGVTESTSGGATYKELCALAQDMGQPELVYKFMDLAGHTALWNSRRGAALAGSSLLDTDIAAQQLRPHAKTLLPRLYVYCYDPSEGVRLAMSSVLRAVAKAAGHKTVVAAVTELFDDIVRHCLKSMTSSQWRVREAGCGALRDALASRKWQEVKSWLQEFWYTTLRVLDDIKESVRKAAAGTGRALAELSVYLCDPSQSGLEDASEAVGIVVPSALKAFTHGVAEVRVLANDTLSRIIRFSGNALKSMIPDLACSLLESATELEPQLLNYAQFHVDAPEELESARATVASQSSSPVIESLERIAGLVDESVAVGLVPRLTQIARSGVGIPTRAATARFINTILRTRAVVMEKYAGRLMKACMHAASIERNSTVRKSWCNALGTASKLAATESVARFCKEINRLSGSDEASERALASFLAAGLWRSAPETARKHGTEILPVAFMGRFDNDGGSSSQNEVGDNWKDVWTEGCPSTDAGLRLYANEICTICIERIESSTQYKVKRSAAVALGSLAKASNSTSDTVLLVKACKALLSALPGRMWDGKIAVIESLGAIAAAPNAHVIWSAADGFAPIVSALLKEAARKDFEYRSAALEALRKVLLGMHHPGTNYLSSFPEVYNALAPLCTAEADTGDAWAPGMDAEAGAQRARARKVARADCVGAVQCLCAAYSGGNPEEFVQLCKVIAKALRHERDVRPGALSALAGTLPRADQDTLARLLRDIMNAAFVGIADAKFAASRRAGLVLLLKLVEIRSSTELANVLSTEERALVQRIRNSELDPGVKSEAKKACSLLGID